MIKREFPSTLKRRKKSPYENSICSRSKCLNGRPNNKHLISRSPPKPLWRILETRHLWVTTKKKKNIQRDLGPTRRFSDNLLLRWTYNLFLKVLKKFTSIQFVTGKKLKSIWYNFSLYTQGAVCCHKQRFLCICVFTFMTVKKKTPHWRHSVISPIWFLTDTYILTFHGFALSYSVESPLHCSVQQQIQHLRGTNKSVLAPRSGNAPYLQVKKKTKTSSS